MRLINAIVLLSTLPPAPEAGGIIYTGSTRIVGTKGHVREVFRCSALIVDAKPNRLPSLYDIADGEPAPCLDDLNLGADMPGTRGLLDIAVLDSADAEVELTGRDIISTAAEGRGVSWSEKTGSPREARAALDGGVLHIQIDSSGPAVDTDGFLRIFQILD